MTTPAVFSADEDLVPVYFPDAAALPDTLAPMHEEAARQIMADLRQQGRTALELADLTDETVEALKVPSCLYVMFLIFRTQNSVRSSADMLATVKFWKSEYDKAMSSAPILSNYLGEVDGVSQASASNDRVWLG
jgi:hypothetical protein